ncbi:MAG: EAL domain-containing protein [Myxococcota bacterium]
MSSVEAVLIVLSVGALCFALASIVRERRVRRGFEATRRAERSVLDMGGDGLVVMDAAGTLLEANEAARSMLWPEAEPKAGDPLPEPLGTLLDDPAAQRHRIRIGSNRRVHLALSQKEDAPQSRRALLLRDVTRQQRHRKHLLRLAHVDSLTGLGNRRRFIDHLEMAIERSCDDGSRIALFYIDIDRFKEVNDTLGHAAGDQLLKSVARRVEDVMERWQAEAETNSSLVTRLSGDEFAIVALGDLGATEIEGLATSILEHIAEPIKFDERSINPSGSAGVSTFPDHASDVEDLVKAADSALYAAKEQGRGRFVLFDESLTAQAEQTRKIERLLQGAIERGELQLHYQPKVELEGDTTAGFEALLRWYSHDLGFVSPKDFIPIAEERGLICEIGRWCIEEACRQIRVWRDAGFETVPVSVNVSSVQFAESDLQREVTDALVRYEVEPEMFEIELTESLILDDNDTTALTLRDLRAIGVRIALDDFGTGYSALTYLNRFPLDVVKMDRGFLRGIENDQAVEGVASAVVSMSHSLGFEVVAEGVDADQQSKILAKMGCDQIQGFLYSPAVPAAEAARFLATVGSPRPKMATSSSTPELDQALAGGDAGGLDRTHDALPAVHGGDSVQRLGRPPETRVLVIDGPEASLGMVSVRMMRLGADVHLVQDVDEACLFVTQEEPIVDLVVVTPTVDLTRVAQIRETLDKRMPDDPSRVLVIGDEPDAEGREALRKARVDWLITGHAEDSELRFFLGAARYRGGAGYMQRSVRVPIESTAWIRAGGVRRVGTLANLSRRGAFVETEDEYEIGQSIRLEFKWGAHRIQIFGSVTYCTDADEDALETEDESGKGIGVLFLEPTRETEDELGEIVEQIWNRLRP